MFVFDSNCFDALEMYFPSRFPSFWRAFDEAVSAGQIISVAEVRKEFDSYSPAEHVQDWVKGHPEFFSAPTGGELQAMAQIFAVPHFQQLIGKKQILQGRPVADPFLISCAWCRGATVVTEERPKPHSAKIPTVCEYFDVKWTNFEGMMTALRWTF